MTARDIVMSAAGNSGDSKTYIEDVFSTYLYTGNGSTNTISNGVDLSGKGGLVWTKNRSSATYPAHCLFDTNRGAGNALMSNTTGPNQSGFTQAFTSTGFTLGGDNYTNQSSQTYASWTFRKAPKFFDVVTWTGDGSSTKTVAHSLTTQPGMVIIKKTSSSGAWTTFARNGANYYSYLTLNTTNSGYNTVVQSDVASSTALNVGWVTYNWDDANTAGQTYVAYLFAHDTTTDGLIQCGSFTTDQLGSATVTLPWEPQYVLMKNASQSGWNWEVLDNMRGFSRTSGVALYPNTSSAEDAPPGTNHRLNSNGFYCGNRGANTTMIYMAIRRGPMKTPTDGTKVFSPWSLSSGGGLNYDSQAYYYDLGIIQSKDGSYGATWSDRLRGIGAANTGGTVITNATTLESSSTAAESTGSYLVQSASGGIVSPSSGGNRAAWLLRRAPGFFDEVCYTGTGTIRTVNHNLGVAPELMIVKRRSDYSGGTSLPWCVYNKTTGNTDVLYLNTSSATAAASWTWNNTSPTATDFTVNTDPYVNGSGAPYVAYLFASCPGVSKVGSYTGTGSDISIDCGFTNGARFVLLKRTNGGGGNWFVFDTARGITSGNDPYLSLNITSPEQGAADVITPYSSGFTVNGSTSLTTSGGEYIYLAIA